MKQMVGNKLSEVTGGLNKLGAGEDENDGTKIEGEVIYLKKFLYLDF